mmetsp:Transcript_2325/g.4285  ORF Transcript_2325/g.4285 Transcript_2325/m.4285 type:complete len:552 (+) Transcript_2325:126-1781(+)
MAGFMDPGGKDKTTLSCGSFYRAYKEQAFHCIGVSVCLSILLSVIIGWPRNYINVRLSIFWFYIVSLLVKIGRNPMQLAPKQMINLLPSLHLISLLIRSALVSVAFTSAAWSVAKVVPSEALSTAQVEAYTIIGLLMISSLIAYKKHRSVQPMHLLSALKLVGLGLLLWTAALWVEDTMNISGRVMPLRNPTNQKLKICHVYVTTYEASPRMETIVPKIKERVRDLGAEWTIFNGTRMPRELQPGRTDRIIKNLISDGYFSRSSFDRVPCGGRYSRQTCLRPNRLFDGRITNLGAAMGHINIMERFVKSHIDEPDCVALVLEDDAILDESFTKMLEQELPTIPGGWDFISLEGPDKPCDWGIWQNEGLNIWHHVRMSDHYTYTPPLSWAGVYTGGYLVTTAGASRIIENLPMTSNIDTWINTLSFYGRINMYLRCPYLVKQGSGDPNMNIPSLTGEGGYKWDKDRWIETYIPQSTPKPREGGQGEHSSNRSSSNQKVHSTSSFSSYLSLGSISSSISSSSSSMYMSSLGEGDYAAAASAASPMKKEVKSVS